MSINGTEFADPVPRGCGTRDPGGCYVEAARSPDGLPLESFLIDPPLAVESTGVRLTPRGMVAVGAEGVIHLLDHVGSKHYPNVADFIEEGRRFGFSRRIAPETARTLTPGSTIVFAHARGILSGAADYYADPPGRTHPRPCPCPKLIPLHGDAFHARETGLIPSPVPMCAGLYWEDIGVGRPVGGPDFRAVECAMPAFTYHAFLRPALRRDKSIVTAFFLRLPIGRLVIVDGGEAETVAARIGAASLRVDRVPA